MLPLAPAPGTVAYVPVHVQPTRGAPGAGGGDFLNAVEQKYPIVALLFPRLLRLLLLLRGDPGFGMVPGSSAGPAGFRLRRTVELVEDPDTGRLRSVREWGE